jgi:hypothetical protein
MFVHDHEVDKEEELHSGEIKIQCGNEYQNHLG